MTAPPSMRESFEAWKAKTYSYVSEAQAEGMWLGWQAAYPAGFKDGAASVAEQAAKVAEATVEHGGDIKAQPEIHLLQEHGENIAALIRSLKP